MNLSARLGRLERTAGDCRVIVMWRRAGEDNAEAYTRWRAEHPGQPAPGPDDIKVVIARWAGSGDGGLQ